MSRKILSLFVSATMLMLYFCCIPFSAVAISKNSINVYEISTAQDLVDFASIVNNGETNANAILTADINMSGINFDPIGTYSDDKNTRGYRYGSVTSYNGTFDGNGYIISNLTVNTSEKIEAGLFSRAIGATIKNVGIKNAKISNTAGVRAGILAGELECCTVSNCFTTGTVSTTEGRQKGGIAGECY